MSTTDESPPPPPVSEARLKALEDRTTTLEGRTTTLEKKVDAHVVAVRAELAALNTKADRLVGAVTGYLHHPLVRAIAVALALAFVTWLKSKGFEVHV